MFLENSFFGWTQAAGFGLLFPGLGDEVLVGDKCVGGNSADS